MYFCLHNWTKWKHYTDMKTKQLHQTRICKKCELIQDKMPADVLGNVKVLFEKEHEPRPT